MDSSAFRTGRRFSNINSDSPISPRDASQFHLRCRWHQSVGDLPRGEEQAWPEVRHPLPDYGLRLRYTNSHHDADCWLHRACCGFPPLFIGSLFCRWVFFSALNPALKLFQFSFSFPSPCVCFDRGAGEEVFPAVGSASLSVGRDMVSDTHVQSQFLLVRVFFFFFQIYQNCLF